MRPAALLTQLLVPLLAITAVSGLSACRRQEPPPPPAPAKPATGWLDSDTTAVAAELGGALAGDGWVTRFRESNGRAPVIEVDRFEDRSGDHVPVDALAAALAHALLAGDRVLTASAGQVADVRLSGVVGLHDGQHDGQPARFFTVDARATEVRTGDPLWVTGIQQLRTGSASAPAPSPAPVAK